MNIETAKKLKWLWMDEHTVEWNQTFIKIADKEGNIVPFVLTDEQKELVKNLSSSNIILKSRQLGISSITIALSIRACVINSNTTCLLVSHNQESTNNIFDKLKQQFNSLPDWLKPQLLTNNRQELKFANGSKITCVTAGNKEIGRGATLNGIVHLSEFAFWKNPEKHLKALTQAVSSSGKIIIESTANGFNKFSEIYMKAKNNENSYKVFFFNWINGKSLFQEQYKKAMQEYKSKNGHNLRKDELTEEEKNLMSIGASLEQIAWRRKKIATDGEDTFHVEYCSTDNECFLTTGSNIFDSNRITTCLNGLIKDKVKPISKSNIKGLIPNILFNYYGTTLDIYKLPQVGCKYWIGVDCSEGLGKDYSTCIVLDKNLEQCAEFHNNKIKPYELAQFVDCLGRFYNKAHLCVEKASGGHTVIDRLRNDYHYMNMTKYKTYDEYNRVQFKVGFDTNNKTKSIAINDFREDFDKCRVLIKSKNLLEEMKVFVMNDNGSMSAIIGSHDDLVMGMALCLQGYKSVWYPF